MKNNQKGFGVFEVIILISVLAALILAGFSFANSRNKDGVPSPLSQVSEDTQNTSLSEELEAGELLEDLELSLASVDDLNKLPVKTPETFKAYLNGVLSKNVGSSGCYTLVSINKISSTNVLGGMESVDAETLKHENCFGGAGTVWYLKDGTWKNEGKQAMVSCDSILENKIYSEFINTCAGPAPNYEESGNPNGSISQLKTQ